VIIQHPEQLAKFIGTAMVTHEHRTSSLGTLMVGYYQSPDGTFARLIMPKVGSAGVYGDTAGAFLKCFFDSKHILNPISDIVFSGTAGGFANTSKYDHFDSERFQGLPQMNVGDIFIPRAFIGDGENMYSLRTAIDLVPNNWIADESGVLDRCKKSLEKANVHHTSAHFSIAAPALETFELIDSLISQGYSSIDVESAPIMEAIREIQGRQPDITFTPLYVYSDDPLNARDDLWASLAYGAPLAEGSRNNHQLHGALRSLIDLSINKKTSFIAG
jgi:hypothetical protein